MSKQTPGEDLIGVEEEEQKNGQQDIELQKNNTKNGEDDDNNKSEKNDGNDSPKEDDNNDNASEKKGNKAKIGEDEVDEDDSKRELTPEEKVRLNYYRWMFFFFFFHFFNFICSTDIINEFSIYLDDDKVYDKFTKEYPNILPSVNMLLTFNVFVLVFFIVAFVLTFRYNVKTFYIVLGVYFFFYLGKFVCSLITITIEPNMNDKFSKWYEEIQEDKKQKYCGQEDYNRCRVTFAWNFFKYEVIFDVIVTTLVFLVYLWRVKQYKIQLIKQLFASESQEYNQLSDQSKALEASSQKPQSDINLNEVSRNNDVSHIQN